MRCSKLLLITSLLVSGCATGSSKQVITCPALKPYTADEQAKAQAEYDALAPDSELRVMLDDAGDLRDQVRRCLEHR